MRSDDALATLLLCSRVVKDDTEPLRAAEYWRLVDAIERPSLVLDHDDDTLAGLFGSSELVPRLRRLVNRATSIAFAIDDLEQSGILTITPHDTTYPSRLTDKLGAKAPPVLHVAGEASLLAADGLGVVGSRDVSPEGATVAREAATAAVDLGRVVVSGAARGVDQLAMNAAFEQGGKVVGVLADALSRAIRQPDTRRAIHEQRVVLCTPYAPSAPFSAGNAMGRNKLIYALAGWTLVVASDRGSGGTWSGAVEALKERSSSLAVWRGPGEGPGNEDLERRGAHPVRTIEDLRGLLLSDGDRRGISPSTQLTLL